MVQSAENKNTLRSMDFRVPGVTTGTVFVITRGHHKLASTRRPRAEPAGRPDEKMTSLISVAPLSHTHYSKGCITL